MNAPTDERSKVRKALGVYVEEAPPAPDWRDWNTARAGIAPRRSRLSGPLIALSASIVVLIVIGGIAALLTAGPDSPSGGQNETSGEVTGTVLVEGVDTWADWYNAVVARAVRNGPDVAVLQGSLGPAPEFDTSNLGDEQRIDPVEQDMGAVPWDRLMDEPLMSVSDIGPLVIAGQVQSVVAGVVPAVYDSNDPANPNSRPPENVLCWDTVSPSDPPGSYLSGPSCTLRTQVIEYGVGSASIDGIAGFADSVMLAVPPNTSLVAIESEGTKLWQRQRGGLAVFVGDLFAGDPEGAEMSWKAYAASGVVIAEGVQSFGTDWGPLAVVAGDAGEDDALIEGTLKISDDCVLLNEQGVDVLLVWPSESTIWNADREEISFETLSGSLVDLRDGDKLRLGGGGSSVDEGGRSATQSLTEVDWVSEPEPPCIADTRWFVADVLDVTPGR